MDESNGRRRHDRALTKRCAKAEDLLARLEQARARLEETDDPDEAIEILQELAELAKEVEAELQRAKRAAETEAATPRPGGRCAGLSELRELVEAYLDELALTPELGTLAEPMRHALGGKRVRPVLCLATGEALGAPVESLLPAAAAVELVHSFSLVHDDLPALDDDGERRGAPSVWAQYGEATAILAGRRAPRRGVPARAHVRHRGGRARAGRRRRSR